MAEELITMTQKQRDWLQWLHQAKRKQITQATAAERMGISERWVRKLLQRMKREKDRVVVHGLRGRGSNRRLAEESRARAVEIIRREYADFGPTLAGEYLAERHGLKVSKETLRGWMAAAGIRKVKKRRAVEIHTWRPRRSCAGELVQWDTSEHDWLEGRGERLYLIAMIDDATSQAIARFAHHDSTLENLRLLRDYLQGWGRPLELYTDQATLFTNAPGWNREAKGEPPKTQIGRALEELGIGWIPAYSPQAKGRQERFFRTAQDRLVKGLRKAGVQELEGANGYLQHIYLPLWNARFSCTPAKAQDAHRPVLPIHRLESILSHREARQITNDYTLRFGGKLWQIPRFAIRPGMRNGTAQIEQRLDGSMAVTFRGVDVPVKECILPLKPKMRQPGATPVARVPKRSKARPRWMDNFDLHWAPTLAHILAQEGR
jgi:transposase